MIFSNPKRLREKLVYYLFLLALLLVVMIALDRSGLLMFFYLIFMPLGVFGVYWITKIIFKKWCLSLLASTIAVGLVVYDLIIPRIWMSNYCEENNSGLHIYEKIENVRGFYAASNEIGCDSTCQDGLLHYKYDFVEAKLDASAFNSYVAMMSKGKKKVEKIAWKYRTFATEPGYYRFYILPSENDPRCEYSNRWLELYYKERYENGLGRLDKYRGICIATEKIEKPLSKYAVSFKNFYDESRKRVQVTHQKISELQSRKIIAEYKRFSYVPNSFFYAHQVLSGQHCPAQTTYMKYTDVLQQPKKGNRE